MTRPCPALLTVATAALLASCGGGNPLANPPNVVDGGPGGTAGKLSFVYFQRCVEPVLQAQLDINIGGVVSRNSCAGAGCHSNVSGTGGALRIAPGAAAVDLSDPANTPDVVRTQEMYQNFYSSQASAIPGNPEGSLLLRKPLVDNVLHGGGLIFANTSDANARLIRYWINRPGSAAQDEFRAADDMFTPADAATGACNTE